MRPPTRPADNGEHFVVVAGSFAGMRTSEVVDALKITGVTVLRAHSFEETLALIRFQPIRLLVLGLDGPHDAWRLLRRIQQMNQPVRVACVSGQPTRLKVLGTVRRGAHAFMVSPFTEIQVRDTLFKLMEQQDNEPLANAAGPGNAVEEMVV